MSQARADNLTGVLSPFLRQRRFVAAKPYVKGRVLDFGCGPGLLAQELGLEDYVGVDSDETMLEIAAARHPRLRFLAPRDLPAIENQRFDTIVGLAVIEHLSDPIGFLQQMSKLLASDGSIVLTTPEPRLDWVHGLGGHFRLFSKESHEEHQSLMGRGELKDCAGKAGLSLVFYRRFLLGANQLAILKRMAA